MSSSFCSLTARKGCEGGRVGEATFPCPQSAQSETLYVKFCYPVRVVNKCNRMPPFSLLWADPTGPLQSIVVVALAAASATPFSSLPSELLLSRAKKTFLVLCPPLEARSYPANSFKCCLCFSCCCRRCVVAVANVGAASVCFSVFALVFVLNSTYSPHLRRQRYAAALACCGPASSYLISN